MSRFLSISFLAMVVFGLVVWIKIEVGSVESSNRELTDELSYLQEKHIQLKENLGGHRNLIVKTIMYSELSLSSRHDELISMIYRIDKQADDLIKRVSAFNIHTPPKQHKWAINYFEFVKEAVEETERNMEIWLMAKGQNFLHEKELNHRFKRFKEIHDQLKSDLDRSTGKHEIRRVDWQIIETDINRWALSSIEELAEFLGGTYCCFPAYQLVAKVFDHNPGSDKKILAFSVDEIDYIGRTEYVEMKVNGEVMTPDEDGNYFVEVQNSKLHEVADWDVEFSYSNPLTGELWTGETIGAVFSLADIEHVE